MSDVKRFEDLIAWQKARVLTVNVYELTRSGALAADFGLRDQLRRACISVMSNIAEGFERCSVPDYLRFLTMAKASCAEVRCQSYIAFDVGDITQAQHAHLLSLTDELARILAGLMAALERRK